MAVKNILSLICRRKGIENPNQLRAKTGLPSGTCQNLWKEGHIPSKKTMGDVCRTLGIQPGDWIIYEEE